MLHFSKKIPSLYQIHLAKSEMVDRLKSAIEKFPRIKNRLVTIRDSTIFYTNRTLINSGLVKTHTDYKKFIIICLPRTGSNLLRSLINSHPNAIPLGELFGFKEYIGWHLRKYPQLKWLNRKKNEKPLTFLNEEILNKRRLSTKAVGFKLFYYHARDDEGSKIWDFIRDNDEIKIIHLRRNNYLRRIISFKKAEVSNKWARFKEDEIEDNSAELKYEECLKDFAYTDAEEKKIEDFFSGKEVFNINYEYLVANKEKVADELLEFIGLPYHKLENRTLKQNMRPLSESITNYFELKEQFSNTRWSKFFEE